MEKEQVVVDEAVETVAEQNTRAYTKTKWTESTPITADKLNKIENGIASALPLAGGTLSGSITLPNSTKGQIKQTLTNGTATPTLYITSGDNLRVGSADIENVCIYTKTNPKTSVDGSTYTLYHTGNKPTANDIGALALKGGTITGTVNFDSSPKLSNDKYINSIDTSGAPKSVLGITTNNNCIVGSPDLDLRLRTNSSTGASVYYNSKAYPIYHTGNKPTAKDVGALPIGGGTLTGGLGINGGKLTFSKQIGGGQMSSLINCQELQNNTGNGQMMTAYNNTIYVGNPNTQLYLESRDNPILVRNGVDFTLYHTGNKPTPAAIGAMPTDNPTFQGNLYQNGPGGKDWIYHINAERGTLNIAPRNNGNPDWGKQILIDRNGQLHCNGNRRVATINQENPAHHIIRYGAGMGGENGYITFSW